MPTLFELRTSHLLLIFIVFFVMFLHHLLPNNGTNGTADNEADYNLLHDTILLLLFRLTTKWPHSAFSLALAEWVDKGDLEKN